MYIKIKYFNPDMPRIKKIDKGDWVDLRVNSVCVVENDENEIAICLKERIVDDWNDDNQITYEKGDVVIMRLGVAMQLPTLHEAEVKPRSSTFKDFGLILTNSVGCIDESYAGDNDEWLAVYYATRNGTITKFDRVVQFRANRKMETPEFDEVETLGNKDRNGFGSTGLK